MRSLLLLLLPILLAIFNSPLAQNFEPSNDAKEAFYEPAVNPLIDVHDQEDKLETSPKPRQRLLNHKSTFGQHKLRADWCQRECAPAPFPQKREPICGSDSHLYKSVCELKRAACRQNVHLTIRHRRHCEGFSKQLSNSHSEENDEEGVRFVELRRRCNVAELAEMKLLLLRQFNGAIESLFKYFDSNGDDWLEAHELWPRKQRLAANKELRFAQLEENPSAATRCSQKGDRKKCWYFLDFPFEPQFPLLNPCSLSHLMLFDLKHPSHKFNLETFREAFATALQKFKHQLHEPIRSKSEVFLKLGSTIELNCLQQTNSSLPAKLEDSNELRCLWTRYNTNLASIQDAHISLSHERDASLVLKDAQLYLSGQFKCLCHMKKEARNREHIFNVQVSATPRVDVRPKFQWSPPNSRVSFECHYDYIDTTMTSTSLVLGSPIERNQSSATDGAAAAAMTDASSPAINSNEPLSSPSVAQFGAGLQVDWSNGQRQLIVHGRKRISAPSSEASSGTEGGEGEEDEEGEGESEGEAVNEGESEEFAGGDLSTRASITMASSRFTLERLRLNDTGQYTCSATPNQSTNDRGSSGRHIAAQDQATLLVEERPPNSNANTGSSGAHLWTFHDNGISIYRLPNDDGQEIDLVREINGHSLVSAEVDGNWNQLTLCGGLNSEQAVICEWSDNALSINVNLDRNNPNSIIRKYIYVGQPNLNRILVLDGQVFEIVAIINTEPQPRKLFLHKPSKIHLSKWVRRKLSPASNARWRSFFGHRHAHHLDSARHKARLYSERPAAVNEEEVKRKRRSEGDSSRAKQERMQILSDSLIQFDIWLLCYGQPLVVNPAIEAGDEDNFYSAILSNEIENNDTVREKQSANDKPFTPRLSLKSQFNWPIQWPPANQDHNNNNNNDNNLNNNKEARLRNRKSVHIIQSTFFPRLATSLAQSNIVDPSWLNNHFASLGEEVEEVKGEEEVRVEERKNLSVVGEFQRFTVLTTHHIFSGLTSTKTARASLYHHHKLSPSSPPQAEFDLIQDLVVPPIPYSLEHNEKHKIHYSYVSHYDERLLYRVNMDECRYDREIDLQNCDPINLITTAQGLLIVQCREPIVHNLIGQLVLDQLSNARIEFNANVRAQESYLSPDNRYLVSIYSNTTQHSVGNKRRRSTTTTSNIESNDQQQRQSIIYVQLVSVNGLRLQYEIKTSLEISQCSFVWKDGYYAAIFVSTNTRDQQSEILSLRLADSRLELMARVPGLISTSRHKDQLVVSPELRLAALSTNQGTYVVDLEENRVSQSLRRHQSPPTLLWV